MDHRLNKKAFSPTVAITVVIAIVIGVLSFMVLKGELTPMYKKAGGKLAEEAKEKGNITTNISLSLEELKAGKTIPSDECGNERGSSKQDPTRSNDTLYSKCVKKDCCEPIVYRHTLDFGLVAEGKFVYLFYYVNGTSTPDNNVLLFYYSKTSKATDWHKFYHTNVSEGNHTIILPVGEEFRFVKVLGMTSTYIDYIEGKVLPWKLGEGKFLDVCNVTYRKSGVNYFYNESGRKYGDIDNLTQGRGYMINMYENGSWNIT